MTTNAEFIKDALGMLGVLRINQTPTASQGVQALRIMNNLFFEWGAKGIDLQYSAQDNLSEDCPIDESSMEACQANLAIRLAPHYSRQASQELIAIAASGYARLERDNALAARRIAKLRNLPTAEGRRFGVRSSRIIDG